MKWKTTILNVNLIILVVGFIVAITVGSFIDKNFTNFALKLFTSGVLALLMAMFIAVNICIRTNEQGIEFRYLWIKRLLNWEEINSFEKGFGVLRLISISKKNLDIPFVWVKDKNVLFDLIKSKVS